MKGGERVTLWIGAVCVYFGVQPLRFDAKHFHAFCAFIHSGGFFNAQIVLLNLSRFNKIDCDATQLRWKYILRFYHFSKISHLNIDNIMYV